MRARTAILPTLLLLTVIGRSSALEIDNGRLKVILHPKIGRFSLYADGIPLFVDRDPRTSGAAVLVDNRTYRLGDSLEFRTSTESLPQGARFVWKSQRLTITQSFFFTSPLSLRISFSITNTSERDLAVGLRLLLDTYLGEESYPHFHSDQQPEINGELALLKGNLPSWWQSSSRSSRNPAVLRCQLKGDEVTEPDRLVFANWKRMSEAGWSYEPQPGRSFSDLPYSINDSAVFQYYDPVPIAPGANRTIELAFQAAQVEQKGVDEFKAPPQSPAAEQAQKTKDSTSIIEDIRALNGLLEELERRLASGSKISDEQLDQMEQRIAELKQRLERAGE